MIFLGDVGGDPPHWEEPGGGSTTGWHVILWVSNHGNETTRAGITPIVGGDEICRIGGDTYVYF